MRQLFFAFFLSISWHYCFAENELKYQASISNGYPLRLLSQNNLNVRTDNTLNESILDLVDARTADTILPRPTQWHRVAIVGIILRTLGFRWQALDKRKYKFVGTSKGGFHAPGSKEHYSEYDMNINLFPHLASSKALSLRLYQAQLKTGRGKKQQRKRPNSIYPYNTDTLLQNWRMHCENTPPKKYRAALNEKFYPCLNGETALHENWCEANPVVGLYGPAILDCNHSCHPEIHPYEWLWWLNHWAFPVQSINREWVVGFIKESSSRFRGWIKSPRVGTISVPFAVYADSLNIIQVEHLVYSPFVPEAIHKIAIPADAHYFYSPAHNVEIEYQHETITTIRLVSKTLINSAGLVWWFSDVQYDAGTKMVSGNLHLGVAVKELYTAKIRITSGM